MEKEPASISKKVEDFLQVFKKGEEFTQELLKDNEKLRYRVAQLEEMTKFSDREGTFKVHSMRMLRIAAGARTTRDGRRS